MARANVAKHDVGGLVTIEKKDIFKLDLDKANVIALYLLPQTLERLIPQLKPGSRIVTHAFEIPGARPDRVEIVKSDEDELEHKIYLWTTPLKLAKPDK
jgi:hypothetical protein